MQTDKTEALAAPAGPPAPQTGRLSRRARKIRDQAGAARRAALLDEYFATLARLRNLQDFFERITDPDLISACVYEMNAVQQQYGHILGRLKAENVTHLKILR